MSVLTSYFLVALLLCYENSLPNTVFIKTVNKTTAITVNSELYLKRNYFVDDCLTLEITKILNPKVIEYDKEQVTLKNEQFLLIEEIKFYSKK